METRYSICIGDLELRPHEHSLLAHGQEVPLTFRELGIVMTLAEHPGWAYSLDQLSRGPEADDYSPESVSVLVSRVRRKLSQAGVADVVETVRGVGYRLKAPSGTCRGKPTPTDDVDREMKDALWQLEEAVIEVRRVGDQAQQREVVDLLQRARRTVVESLEERLGG